MGTPDSNRGGRVPSEHRDRYRITEPCGRMIRLRDGSPVYFIVNCAEKQGHAGKHHATVAADLVETRGRITVDVTWTEG